jgi:hypothetical protein
MNTKENLIIPWDIWISGFKLLYPVATWRHLRLVPLHVCLRIQSINYMDIHTPRLATAWATSVEISNFSGHRSTRSSCLRNSEQQGKPELVPLLFFEWRQSKSQLPRFEIKSSSLMVCSLPFKMEICDCSSLASQRTISPRLPLNKNPESWVYQFDALLSEMTLQQADTIRGAQMRQSTPS